MKQWRIISRSYSSAGNDVVLQARLIHKDATGTTVTNEGKAIKRADCTALTATLYKLTNGTWAEVGPLTIDFMAAISDTLVDDDIWKINDGIGRNFLHTVPGSNFAVTARYRVHYELTLGLTGSPAISWAHEIETLNLDPTA